MKCNKLFTVATLAVMATVSMAAHAGDTHQHTAQAKAPTTQNPNEVITNTLFPNASPADKARLQDQIKKYSQLQYGFETAAANPSPQKDGDIMKNIKAHDPATVKSQMAKMRQAALELPKLQQVPTSALKP